MEKLSDLSISGVGKTPGGKFRDVDISGLGKVLGDVEAERVVISGKGTIEGNAVVTRKMEISGMGTITGNVTGGEISSSGTGAIDGLVDVQMVESSGNLRVSGEAKIKELFCSGRCRFDKSLKGEKVTSHGLLSAGGDVEVEEFHAQGSFSVDGLLNAHHIDVEIHGYCQAKEIGGEDIRVRSGKYISASILAKLINPFLGTGRQLDKLTANLIEGTNVSLEYTSAKIVRGNKVIIGPNCTIDLVEYTDSLEVNPRAQVANQSKLD
ncbi:MAG: polymer-forming cytoskeletal protein [Peptococcaceae bacterium]|nr:polymer-forming cytoskeletal protein [Peptococcaceae bacterium]